MKCDVVQGFHFSHAVPAGEIAEFHTRAAGALAPAADRAA